MQNYVLQNKIDVMSNPERYKSLKEEVLERLIEQKILITKANETICALATEYQNPRGNTHLFYEFDALQ